MTRAHPNDHARPTCHRAARLLVAVAGCVLAACSSPRGASNDPTSLAATGAPLNAPVGSASKGDGGAGSMQGRRKLPEATAAASDGAPGAIRPAIRIDPWTNGERAGHEIVTEHLEIRTTLRNSDLRKFLPEFTESALAHYTSALGVLPVPSSPLQTYIFGSRDEWAAFTTERLGRDADAYLGLGRGGYTSNATAILYDIGTTDTLTILAHEGWHQYSQAVFRDELPVWLEEGISTYMEGYRVTAGGVPNFEPWRNFERFGQLRDTVRRNSIIPLAQLLDGTPQGFLQEGRERLLCYYAQVWALTHFLAEGSDSRFRAGLEQLVRDAAAGTMGATLSAAVKSNDDRRALRRGLDRGGVRAIPSAIITSAYFSAQPADLAAEYEAFVRAICERGSGDRIWRGVSPIQKKPLAITP